jgi:hypothetical protein
MKRLPVLRLFALSAILSATLSSQAVPVTNGLVLHLDAGSLSGLADGQQVSTWLDLSGNGNHATARANPTFQQNVLNGLPVVHLGGGDTFHSPLATSDHMSIFVVVKGSQYYSLIRWQQENSWFVYHWGPGTLIQSENGNLIGPPTGLVANEWNLGSVLVDQGPSGGVRVFRNGALQGTATYNTAWGPIANLYIGSLTGLQEFTIGDVAEILIYHRALAENEHQQVLQFLSQKYNIALAATPPPRPPERGEVVDANLKRMASSQKLRLNRQNVRGDYLEYGIPVPQKIYYLQEADLTRTQKVLFQSLQGLTARTRPELCIASPGNLMWLQDLSNYGVALQPVKSSGTNGALEWALDAYRNRYSSYILCDAARYPDSLTAAVALAAAMPDSLVVDVADEPLMKSRNVPMLLDVRGKNDLWVFNNYRNSLKNNAIFIQTNDISQQGAYLRDLPITIQALTWWNSSSSESDTVFAWLHPDVPAHGWDDRAAPGELGAVMYHSQNSLWTAADNWMLNLSTYAGMASLQPGIEFHQPASKSTYAPEDNVHYVAFCLSDMDNLNALYDMSFAQGNDRYASPYRGTFPMGWGMAPSMVQLGPTVLKWWYDHATKLDGFIGYSSGLGYFYPSHYPALDQHLAILDKYLAKADLKALCILDSLWPRDMTFANYRQIGEQYGVLDSLRGFFYADVNGDYARYRGKILWFSGKPMVTCRYTLWNESQYKGISSTGLELANSINSLPATPSTEGGYSFVIVHAWTHGMNEVRTCVNYLHPHVRVVTPVELIEQLYLHNLAP